MYKMAFCLSIVFVSLGTSASTGSLQCTASSYNFFSRESVDIDLTRISKDYYQGSTNLHHFSVQALSFTTGDGWGIRIENLDSGSVLSKAEAYFSASDMHKPINLFGRNESGTASIDCFRR
jgi:hypothetical protein